MGANQSDFECEICANDSVDLHLLPCTHSMCADCLGQIFDDKTSKLRCPFCRSEFSMSREEVEALPKKAPSSVAERIERLFSREHERKITNDAPVEEQPTSTSSAEQDTPDYEFENNNTESETEFSDVSSIGDTETRPQARRMQQGQVRTAPTAQPAALSRRDARTPVVVLNTSSAIRVQQAPPGGERLARRILKKAEMERRKREIEAAFANLQRAERRSGRSGRRSNTFPAEVARYRSEDAADYARRAAEQELRVKSLVERFRATPETKDKVSRFILSIQSTTAM